MKIFVDEVLGNAVDLLKSVNHIESPVLEAELLLSHTLGKSGTYLMANPRQAISPDKLLEFNKLLEHRQTGVPVAYLLGTKEFWSVELAVTDQVLIPRPDTETLVQQALCRCIDEPMLIADLGTGSGAIAVVIAIERPHCQLVAVDRSCPAVNVARSNVARLGLDNIEVITSNWFDQLSTKSFDLIVSNPPYICAGDAHLSGELRFEPRQALVADSNGLGDLSRIIVAAPNYLKSKGWLLVEHGYNQAPEVTDLFAGAGFGKIKTYPDLAGIPRVTEGQISE